MKKLRSRSALRFASVAIGIATAAVGLSAPSASALSRGGFNSLRNAQSGQRCLDIRTTDPAEGARAQLRPCYHPDIDGQQFLLRATSPGGGLVYDEMEGKGARGTNRCLFEPLPLGSTLIMKSCGTPDTDYNVSWNWTFNVATGQIFNVYSGWCLAALGDYDNAPVTTQPCNGSLSQRWYI